jgi:hypothetical protein
MKVMKFFLFVVLIKCCSTAVIPEDDCQKESEDQLNGNCNLGNFATGYFKQLENSTKTECYEKLKVVSDQAEKCEAAIKIVEATKCKDDTEFFKIPLGLLQHYIKFMKFSCKEELENRDIYGLADGCISTVYQACIDPLEMETFDLCK